ncbi:MAG: helix-turn-helix domain-containing protein [Dehalococcoidia bacterium]
MRVPRRRKKANWDGDGIRALRRHLGLTQQELADELGTRQQTVSEWETGMYRPRGASSRLLTIIAERAGFGYEGGSAEEGGKT